MSHFQLRNLADTSDDSQPLTRDYDDDSLSTTESEDKYLNSQSFAAEISAGRGHRYGRRRFFKAPSWWVSLMMFMRPRARSTADIGPGSYKDDFENGPGEILFADTTGSSRQTKNKRPWYSYCIFCGISKSSVLAILLTLNLGLIFALSFWPSDNDTTLQNWGTPGSGTEGLAWYPTDFLRDVVPIHCHSHNDYWRRVPLFSALRAGCIGTEADVWLFDEELYVGHNTASLTKNRTFHNLYVDPLVKILERQNQPSEFYNGSSNGVFDGYPEQTLALLIDVKTSGKVTWPAVLAQLEPLRKRGWLTFVEDGVLHERPITVVGTGNTPFDLLTSNTTYRDAFFDAPLELMWEARSATDQYRDTDSDKLPSPKIPKITAGQGMTGITANSSFTSLNSYYASIEFSKIVGLLWRGKLTNKHLNIIRGQIRGAHRRGLKVRYWGLPSWPIGLRNSVWDVLVQEGVDLLNVDDLQGVSKLSW